MHKSSALFACWLVLVIAASLSSSGQVVAAVEIKDPELRALQVKYMDDLKATGAEILGIPFEYPFYLSRKLALDEQAQKSADQRSLRFDRYEGRVVVAITGNYYAAYNAQHLSKEQRARATFLNVAMPILKATVPKFQNNKDVQGYALEISHHILGKVMGVSMERPENVFMFFPQNAALKVLNAKDDDAEQAALVQGQFFVNAEPISPWPNVEAPHVAAVTEAAPDAPATGDPAPTAAELVAVTDGHSAAANNVPSFPKRSQPSPQQPPRDTSPEAIAKVEAANKDAVTKLVKELDPQAHFVGYAEPSFIVFRGGLYLQLSLNTNLGEGAGGSRYRMAANAFDDHIARLVRPAVGYFKEDPKQAPNFDGISFSTTVHMPEKKGAPASSEAVEYYFPFPALRCYQKYDCTGQQLLDAGTVLINGERVSLDLQIAEGVGH
jgi:hypothetical protein